MEAKSILKSKQLWANVLAIVLLLTNSLLGIVPADLPATTTVPILAIGNILLRLITKQPVKLF